MSDFYIPPSVEELIENERQAFIMQFGREPDQFDPMFFDPSEEEIPLPMPRDQLQCYLQAIASRVGIKPSHLFAYFCAAREPKENHRQFVYNGAIEEYRFLGIPKQ